MSLPIDLSQFSQRINSFSEQFIAFNWGKDRLKGWFRSSPKNVLVIESTGFEVRAAIVNLHDGMLHFEQVTSDSSIIPNDVLGEVIAKIERDGLTLPDSVVVLTSYALPVLIDLPVLDDGVLGEAQLSEIIRWDMEGLINEQSTHWARIGWLLVGRGYLSEEQRECVLAEMAAAAEQAKLEGLRIARQRFGDVALAQQFISIEQLEDCLAMQADLNVLLLDNAIDFNYTDLSGNSNANQKSCLAVGMSRALRAQWLTACEKHKLRLAAIYPTCGISTAAFANTPKVVAESQHDFEQALLSDVTVILEIHSHCIIWSRIEQQKLTHLIVQNISGAAPVSEQLMILAEPLLDAEVAQIWWVGHGNNAITLIDKLQGCSSIPMKPLSEWYHTHNATLISDKMHSEGNAWFGSVGAMQHYFGLVDSSAAVSIVGHPPPPPLHQRPNIQQAAAIVFLMLTVLSIESYYYWQQQSLEQRLAVNVDKASQNDLLNETITQKNTEADKLSMELSELTAQAERLSNRKELMEVMLINRQQFVKSLLPLLANIVPDAVTFNQLVETQWYEFKLDGWATSQSAIDEFNTDLSRAIAPWSLYISDSPSEVQRDKNGLDGYHFVFTLSLKDAVQSSGNNTDLIR